MNRIQYKLIFLFLIAFTLRMVLPLTGFSGEVSDSPGYLSEARGIIEGKGFIDTKGNITSFRAPTYPIFLSGMLAVTGNNIFGVQLIQALLASLLAPLIFYTVNKLAGETRAFIAGLIFSIDPGSIPFSSLILTEAIGSVLIYLWFLSWLRTAKNGKYTEYFWNGLLGGAMVYQTMITMLLHPIAILIKFICNRKLIVKLIFSLIIFCLPIAGWTIRNSIAFNEMTISKSYGYGFLLWSSMNYDFPWLLSPYDERGDYIFKQERKVLSHYSATEAHKVYKKKAIARLRAEPVKCIWRSIKGGFWSWVDVPGAMKSMDEHPYIKFGIRIINIMIMIIAAIGIPSALKTAEGRIALGIIFYFAFFHAPLYPIPRYYVPVRPLIALLCAFAGKKRN